MSRKWIFAWSLPLLLVLVSAIHAGEKTADAPAVVVRIKSLNALLQNLNLVVKLIGQEDAAHQIEAAIKSKIGKDGIQGVDPSRPLGAYVRFGKEIDDVNGAIVIPIADEKAFLTLLDNMEIVYKKDKDGIYTHKTSQGVDLYFRFAHKSLFVTSASTESIQDKNLADPAKALAVPSDATLSIITRLDQIPKDAKLIALAQLEDAIQAAQKNGLPNETKAQAEFRITLLDDLSNGAKTILRDGAELRFDLDLNDKTKEITVDWSVAGKPGSELAKSIQKLGSFKSPLAGLLTKDAAFQGTAHVALPQTLHKAFAAVIDDVAAKSLAGIQDAQKKKQAETLFQALMPTAKEGDYQVAAAVLGPKDERYTFIAAVKLKDGAKLGATVEGLIGDALKQIPEAERGKIQLDFAKVGAIKIHKFEVPKNAVLDKLIDEAAGDKYLYVAFRDDAVFLALGKEALPTLQAALGKTEDVAGPPLLFDIDVARMAKWTARTPEQKAAAEKLLAERSPSRLRLTIDGGATLHAHLQMSLNVLEFVVKTGTAKGK